MNRESQAISVLTIGHSTRPLADFLAILQAHEVEKVADVRTVPRSRHNPQFNKETLPQALAEAGIGYVHLPGLGGLRHPLKDSPNMGWRNDSFRGFADYMQTPEFEENLLALIDLAKDERLVLMCAETLPWRCHRSLIADALTVRGIKVEHIISETKLQEHRLIPFAQVEGDKVTYPKTESP
ncbi:MAG: DUF488 domain-containing protein [Deltaproteobacteria bacterium]|nr:DUF488 domain-containing protein [Deltaproteobacteria bacterium]